MKKRDLNEALKHWEQVHRTEDRPEEVPTRVLSPGMLVLRRFLRNKLALVGSGILALMFLFAFLGPFFYPYGQTQVFGAYKELKINYAMAQERQVPVVYPIGEQSLSDDLKSLLSLSAAELEYGAEEEMRLADGTLRLYKSADRVYAAEREGTVLAVCSAYLFEPLQDLTLTEDFKARCLLALGEDGKFSFEGKTCSVQETKDGAGVLDADGQPAAVLSTLAVHRFSGEDTLPPEFKERVRQAAGEMARTGTKTGGFSYEMPRLDENGLVVLDETGQEAMVPTELQITETAGLYTVTCHQYTYMLDRFASPSRAHLLGTDGDGMDILARMMAGGRISLLVGFVVVILEVLLGVALGGLAGYFGGWVDNLVMRLVDVFYCIPSMPILIILGAMLDALHMAPYARLAFLMAVLGLLGWAGIARLVRGQILSLREQDFMVAAEAIGLPVRRRIFRHLIPNVMPQLIVAATMGLGSVILTESTLSFLGLGVKHPMATWGTMINSVATSAQAMTRYTYIWIPVGALICLTVIAFNFVGDGLRDAFDPKMKR